ncbi:MAG: hypothetical protein HOO96_04925 [Polyangiaceae bacterium]|nr:hypothetical protein [Polyangiaceae bacterium]
MHPSRLAVFGIVLFAGGAAHAQSVATPSVSAPPTLVLPGPATALGDDAGTTRGLSLDTALMPLRLSLGGGTFPHARFVPACADSSENVGTSASLPQQRAAALHLTPALSLVGFSTITCPVDAQVSAGLVYTAPIRRDLWLVASTGVTLYPTTTFAPAAGSPRTDARVDLTWKRDGGAVSFGVGLRGFSVAGAF